MAAAADTLADPGSVACILHTQLLANRTVPECLVEIVDLEVFAAQAAGSACKSRNWKQECMEAVEALVALTVFPASSLGASVETQDPFQLCWVAVH